MAKNLNVSQFVAKILFSGAILQLMLICFVLTPPSGTISVETVSLRAYLPEMTEYAALTAVLSRPL